MTYADRMHKSLVGRTGDWLARNRSPYLVVLGAYAIAAIVAYQSSVSFQYFGVKNTIVRFALSFLAGYLFFALSLSFWLCFLPAVDRNMLLDGAGRGIETACPSDFVLEPETGVDGNNTPSSHCAPSMLRFNGCEAGASGLPGLMVALVILGLVVSFAFSLYYSRWCLGLLMVKTGKVDHRSVNSIPRDAWLFEPLRQTFWPAFGLLLHVLLLGSVVSQLPV